MKILESIAEYVGNMRFRTKLVISYMLLISIPLMIISYKYYNTSMNAMSELAGQNALEIVKQSNQIMDSKLAAVESDSLKMINDRTLFTEIQNADRNNLYSIMQMDRKLTEVLDKYFSEDEYYSANILTSYYMFGNNSLGLQYQNFGGTDIYKQTVKADGGILWIPTYDFLKMFHISGMDQVKLDFRYLFSATRLLNCFYNNNGAIMTLGDKVEKPVLIVSFKEESFERIFEKSTPVKGSYYFVVDRNRKIISHSDKSKIATYEKALWLDKLFHNRSGTETISIDGKDMIVCFDTSKVTGWLSVVVIPRTGLVSNLTPVLKSYTLRLLLLLALIAMVVAFIISGSITKPLHKLLLAMKKTGQGDFKTKLETGASGEIGYLIDRYNNMNAQIGQLIEENYLTRIREKETEIMALNIQLNPHFLYNTLNIINWLAIENGQSEISKLLVSLSEMLQYTARNTNEMERFEDDFLWLQNYITIMMCRFEGKFNVEYDIDNGLFDYMVPKLFLQPFVENAIIHGFENMESGGIIRISGSFEGRRAIFCVQDNGAGFGADCTIGAGVNADTESKVNIGIKNVNRRIKLIYGEEYGVTIESKENTGTVVRIQLPVDVL